MPFETPALQEAEGGLYFDSEPEDEYPAASAIAQLRKKKPVSVWLFIMPILGVAAIAGGVYAYLKASEPKFVGDVAGKRFDLKKPITVTISWQEAGAGEEEQKVIRSILDKKPLPLASPLTVVSFSSDGRGIVIEAKNGYDTDIVQVDPQQIPIVANWLLRNGEKLQISRSTTIGPAAREFATKIGGLIQSQSKITSSEFAEFRDRLALPALNKSLGHWCGAVVDNQIYPCIFEDPQGLLYFAVPTNARFFQVREKGTPPAGMLPPTFQINVSLPPRAPADSPFSQPGEKGTGKMEPSDEKMSDDSMPEKAPETSPPGT